MAPDQVPFIAREYAQELEYSGNYVEALFNYEKGCKEDIIHGSGESLFSSSPETDEHIRQCKAGIARTSIRTGDYRRGIQFAVELNEKQLYRDCAEGLAAVGHIQEAAGLLEKANIGMKVVRITFN